MKYRKKPVVIEAFQLGKDYMPGWFMDAVSAKKVILHMSAMDGDPCALIETLEGTHRARADRPGARGDFIIQGVQGELYPCKPDIFAATYERVEEAEGDE